MTLSDRDYYNEMRVIAEAQVSSLFNTFFANLVVRWVKFNKNRDSIWRRLL